VKDDLEECTVTDRKPRMMVTMHNDNDYNEYSGIGNVPDAVETSIDMNNDITSMQHEE
jgi:hypothetical protein